VTVPTIVGRTFTLGKYTIIGRPIPYSAHMLVYSVYVDGRCVGTSASEPNEADCRSLEVPPYVPPSVPWQANFRPNRFKKV